MALALLTIVPAPTQSLGAGPCDYPVQKARPAHVAHAPIAPLAIGDSTMIYAVPALGRDGFDVNARKCRPFAEGIEMLKERKGHPRLPQFVVLALGASSLLREIDVDRALQVLGPGRV